MTPEQFFQSLNAYLNAMLMTTEFGRQMWIQGFICGIAAFAIGTFVIWGLGSVLSALFHGTGRRYYEAPRRRDPY